MAGQIRMTPDTMRTRSNEANQQAIAVKDVMTKMDNLLKTLQGEWEGDAMKGYEARYQKIRPSFKSAMELIEEIRDNLKTTAKILEDTDKSIGSQFRA